jgi:ethanolamine utilization protein EutA
VSPQYRPVEPDEIGFSHHDAMGEPSAGSVPDPGWEQDNIVLATVGIDIGSTTSHIVFARLHMQRLARSLSSRYAAVERRILHRSPILLTPFRDDESIDVDALREFIDRAYLQAGISRDDIDTGAVILTGAARERENARAVADLFAREGGKFVCASAGHRLEALLAAHGSGAVALSGELRAAGLHVDVGGGTTKLALLDDGEVRATSALAVGARLVAFDAWGAIVRIEPAAERIAAALGAPLRLGASLEPADRSALASRLADLIAAAIHGQTSDVPEVQVLEALPPRPSPAFITFSGGVAEYLYGRDRADYGDLGRELAEAIRQRSDRLPAPVVEVAEGIRATVIGASQFSIQLSGNTIFLSDRAGLPLRSLPVATVRLDSTEPTPDSVAENVRSALARLDVDHAAAPPAVAVRWPGEPRHAALRAIAEGIVGAVGTRRPIVVALQGDIAQTLGRILVDELGVREDVVVLDGLELEDLDYVDIGEPVRPANVVPVVIKSLVFGEIVPTSAERSRGMSLPRRRSRSEP